MSDKFFFKGRQDARENHIKYGFETKTHKKSGTKKHPLNLVVTNDARKVEVEALVDDAQLHAEIIVDDSDGAARIHIAIARLIC